MKVPLKSSKVESEVDSLIATLDKLEVDVQHATLTTKLQAMQVRATLLLTLAVDELGYFARDSAHSLDYFTDHLGEVGSK